ncbi:MAG: phage tail assembly chaperone [Pseudomonadota bacterium]
MRDQDAAAMRQAAWRGRMEIAFGMLNLTPDVFWTMSVAEWRCACSGLKRRLGAEGFDVEAPLVRADLKTLMEQYPDERAAP